MFTGLFGVLIDVPLVVGGFLAMFRFRKKLVPGVLGLAGRFPVFGIYILLCVPLIVFEEQINCMPAWCGQVLIPPTLPFILVEMLILGVLGMKLGLGHGLRVVLVFAMFGVFWEALLGGLVGAPLLVTLILAPYVMVSYGFVSLLPLLVLLEKPQPIARAPLATEPVQIGQ